ncbi:Maf family nucleotide pyrophosphatase [Bacteroidales bacterium MB20-C3-3]|jgi:septum formation protein|nr:Maf family nucleotide pyrophosphatase [Bacteroidales bacterium MB20-C3-3]
MRNLVHMMTDRILIVASASPRRHQLIAGLDIPYNVEISGHTEEVYDTSVNINSVPLYLAKMKSFYFGRELKEEEILLTADTLVICEGEILGKPSNREEATKMLMKLSGKAHNVITGVYLRSIKGEKGFSASTVVYFKTLSEEEIDYYVEHYKPYDKAGAYGAQEWIGYIAIEKIEGSYFNVMGLPVQKLYNELQIFIDQGY